ncbi:hypothetical protein Vadar_026522 [Vaccinium darrowii]|uniref:Uncharacterized protein n=1 Tax=Vaccinium darrowii TaxID=229202 RepID=A0ACB7YQF0_9ERIC|nr:hypothetical protein Vadar_026522 [Vaccinium darrowii]
MSSPAPATRSYAGDTLSDQPSKMSLTLDNHQFHWIPSPSNAVSKEARSSPSLLNATNFLQILVKMKVLRETNYRGSCSFHAIWRQIRHQSSSIVEDEVDPFLVVKNELFILANRLRSIVVAEVPEYFFKKQSDFNQQERRVG